MNSEEIQSLKLIIIIGFITIFYSGVLYKIRPVGNNVATAIIQSVILTVFLIASAFASGEADAQSVIIIPIIATFLFFMSLVGFYAAEKLDGLR